METPFILFILNGLMTVAVTLGGIVLKGALSEIKGLREADTALTKQVSDGQAELRREIQTSNEKVTEKLSNYTHKDEFREFRQEQREMFDKLFDKIDGVKEQLSSKVDRREHPRT